MSASRCTWLAWGVAFALCAAASGIAPVQAETGSGTDPSENTTSTLNPAEHALAVNPAVGVATDVKPSIAVACANPDALGVSRVVEINTATGPEFGDQYLKTETKFLEPGEVVLTFDDGTMRRYTRPVLDALDEQCVK